MHTTTLGFRPACACYGHFEERKVQESYAAKSTGTHDTVQVYVPDEDVAPIPATILDPFAGSGTTLLVAKRMGLNAIGLDLSYQYLRENAWERVGMNAPVMV